MSKEAEIGHQATKNKGLQQKSSNFFWGENQMRRSPTNPFDVFHPIQAPEDAEPEPEASEDVDEAVATVHEAEPEPEASEDTEGPVSEGPWGPWFVGGWVGWVEPKNGDKMNIHGNIQGIYILYLDIQDVWVWIFLTSDETTNISFELPWCWLFFYILLVQMKLVFLLFPRIEDKILIYLI